MKKILACTVNPLYSKELTYSILLCANESTFLFFQVITFLKKKEGFIGLVLKHIDASAMMDLLLRLISCVEPAPLRQEVLHVSDLNMSLYLP